MQESETDPDLLFGEQAVREGRATPQQVRDCLRRIGELNALGVQPLPSLKELLEREALERTPRTQPSPRSTSVPEGEVFGKYVRTSKLGEGGMGEVWKAWDTQLARWVALKFLKSRDAKELERFRREAQTSARLVHSNIAAIYEAGDGFISMQFVDGKTLSKAGPLPAREAARLVLQAAQAVQFAHDKGVIHRDLKPANLMLQGKTVFVMDFGLARATDVEVSASGSVVGTPAYMSPEQAKGDKCHARSDVYSLGATLYELLSGRAPFGGNDVFSILKQVFEKEPEPLKGTPRDLNTIVMKCLDKNAAERYASAQDLGEDLERFLDGEPIQARPMSTVALVFRRGMKHRAILVPSFAAVLLAIGFGTWMIVKSRESKKQEQERRTREARLNEAEGKLEKFQAVNGVLRRWSRLRPPLREMETCYYDSSATPEQRRKNAAAAWASIDDFIRATPPDATSQSVMKAFAGWARVLAGQEDEGVAMMRESRSLDPEVPFGYMTEALLVFAKYVQEQSLPRYVVVSGTQEMGFGKAEGENEKMRALRAQLEDLLREAGSRPLWGKDAEEDFRSAIEGIRFAQSGDYAASERALTKAMTSNLEAFETGLILARAEARYLQKKFREGAEDMDAVLRVRPRHAEAHCRAGLIRAAEASQAADSTPLLEKALASLTCAVEYDPRYAEARNHRGIVLARLGAIRDNRGIDPEKTYREAVEEFGRAVEIDPRMTEAFCNRGSAYLNWGASERRRRRNPEAMFRRALEDYEIAIRRDPGLPEIYLNRAETYLQLAGWDLTSRRDPRPNYRRAIEDLEFLIRRSPNFADAHFRRGRLHAVWGEIENGAERVRQFTLAAQSYGEALRIHDKHWAALFGRGAAYLRRAESEADPRESAKLGLADLDRLIRENPDFPAAYEGRGTGLWILGQTEADPVPTFRKAIADLNEATRRDVGSAGPYNIRGNIYLKVQEYEKAIQEYGEVLRRVPQYWQAYANQGQAYEMLGRFKEAVTAYESALKIAESAEVRELCERARKRVEQN